MLVFGVVYFFFALLLYFGLKIHLKNNFSKDILNEMILSKSLMRDTTTDLCKYQILGDPKEFGNYVKIEINCDNGKKALSTLSLSAIEDKTIGGVIEEYSRIIGFDVSLLDDQKYKCYIDGIMLTEEMKKENIRLTSTLRCLK